MKLLFVAAAFVALCGVALATSATSACQECTFIADRFMSLMGKNVTEATTETVLENMCQYLKPVEEHECDQFVEAYLPVAFKAFNENESSAKLCQQIKFCPASLSFEELAADSVAVSPAQVCTACKTGVAVFEKYIQNQNVTAAYLAEWVEKACPFFPKEYQKKCTVAVETIGTGMFQAMIDGTDPAEICQFVKACPSTVATAPSWTIVSAEAEESVADINVCTACTVGVEASENYISSHNVTVSEITEKAEKACTLFPQNQQGKCKFAVATVGRVIFQSLVSGDSPTKICEKVKACPASSSDFEFDFSAEKKNKEKTCPVCKMVTQKVVDLVKSGKGEAATVAAVEKSCDFLGAVAPICKLVVIEEGPKIYKKVVSHVSVDPEHFCEEVHLC